MSRNKVFKFVLLMGTLFLFCLFLWINEGKNQRKPEVVLNEICCRNKTIIYDKVGVFRDYIEVYNPSDKIADLSGYALSDDKQNKTKYVFPDGMQIEPGGYLIMWAGNRDDSIFTSEEKNYLGFGLKAGEVISFSDNQGHVLQEILLPDSLGQDMVYARTGVGDAWKIGAPTPGAENTVWEKPKNRESDAEVNLSAKSGFYPEAFALQMSTQSGYSVYYTLDGTTPDAESAKYTEPVWIENRDGAPNEYASIGNISTLKEIYVPTRPVDKGVVVRAVAIDENGTRGKEICATYFVGYQDKEGFEGIPVLSLVTDPENLFDFEKGIYVTGKVFDSCKDQALSKEFEYLDEYEYPGNYKGTGAGWKRPAQIQYFDETGQLQYRHSIRIGIHGGWSTASTQKSFNLYVDESNEDEPYIFPGLFGKNLTTVMLRNGGVRDAYATKIRDVLNQQLVEDRDVYTSPYKPCQLFLDGEYWGLYFIQERVVADSVTECYDVNPDNVVILKNREVVCGEEQDIELWDEMVSFALNNDLSKPENYAKIQEMMDVQSFIDAFGFQVYVGNCDSISNNHARWRVKKPENSEYGDGRWRWILYDTDDSAWILGNSGPSINHFNTGNWEVNLFGYDLFLALYQNEEFKNQFMISFMDMANYNFREQKVLARIAEWEKQYGDEVVKSHQRFVSPDYTDRDYREAMDKLRDFYSERYDYMMQYLAECFLLQGEFHRLVVEPASFGGQMKLNTLCLDATEGFEGNYFSDVDCVLEAVDNEQGQFSHWVINGEIYKDAVVTLDMETDYAVTCVWKEQN